MPPTDAPALSASDATLFQIGALLAADPPEFKAARALAAAFDADSRPRADKIIDAAEALHVAGKPTTIGKAAQDAGALLSGNWRTILLVLALAGGAGSYRFWPAGEAKAPLEAADMAPTFPPFLTDATGRATTFQHGRHKELRALPLPTTTTLNTPLAEWDRRDWYKAAWVSPYQDRYYVEGGLYLDKDNLYIAARVGDPWPLRNKSKPDLSSDGGWQGGALQLRLMADADPYAKGPPETPTPVHLTLWSHAGRGCLHIQSGLAFSTKRAVLLAPDERFDAIFQPEAQGYAVRCRIEWKEIGFAEAPSGRNVRFCWEVVWADHTGEQWVGKLTDFFDPVALQ